MRRIRIAALAALALLSVPNAGSALGQSADPEKTVAEISSWYAEQIRTAQQNNQRIDGAKLMAERSAKAKAAVAGVNADTIAAEKGLAWAQLYNFAQMYNEQIAAAARFVATNPEAARKYQAHSLMLGGYNQTGQAEKLLQLLGEVRPASPPAAASLAMMTANVYSETIADKLGPQKALDVLQKVEALVPFADFKTDQEKNMAETVVVYTATSRSDLLTRLGKRDEALAALESAKGRLSVGSRMLGSLEGKIVQARLPGSPAPELKAAQNIGDFAGLAALKGKVVLLDFFAHW